MILSSNLESEYYIQCEANIPKVKSK